VQVVAEFLELEYWLGSDGFDGGDITDSNNPFDAMSIDRGLGRADLSGLGSIPEGQQ
jgi:hypothetical protein